MSAVHSLSGAKPRGAIRSGALGRGWSRAFGVPVFAAALALATAIGLNSRAADEAPKPTLFLPKSPIAAAYVLGRLTNQELIQAPRGEFVYVALLQRKGLEKKYRTEALEGLAKIRGTDPLTELIVGLGELDQKGEDFEPVARDLGGLLLAANATDLAAKRSLLEPRATDSQLPLVRQIAYAALITGDASLDRAWNAAAPDAAHLTDLLLGIPLIRDGALRATAFAKAAPLAQKSDSPETQRAAMTAITAAPGHEAEAFTLLTGLELTGVERATAVASLGRIPKKSWPKEQLDTLADDLLTYLQSVPAADRTETPFLNAIQFATDLASALPLEKARAYGKTLRGLGATVIVLHAVIEQMIYDKTSIVAEAGKTVEIILQNDDSMPHNLTIVTAGAVEEIGTAAEKMPPDPDAEGRLYVPSSAKVLYATKMVEPGQKTKLAFTAPATPGEYAYLCTFPGHWRRMFGTLTIVSDLDAYLASHATPTEPKTTEWKIGDFAADLAQAGAGRNLARGKELFAKLACQQCHKLGAEGYSYGPELTDVFKRYNQNRADVLRQILEPSLIISNRYQNVQFELKNGDTLLGMVVKEDADSVAVQSGPADSLIQAIKKSEIKERQPQTSSPMPVGLLYSLSKEEIFDLLAFLEAGGALGAAAHDQH